MLSFSGVVTRTQLNINTRWVTFVIEGTASEFSFSTSVSEEEAPRVGDKFNFTLTKEPSLVNIPQP